MRTTLALVGCGGRVEVALAGRGLPAPSLVALSPPQPKASLLLRAVQEVLEAAGIDLGALELIVASRGPGSFTGIRNTLACAFGLSLGRGIPLHGFSSLLMQAARTEEEEVLAVQPARRGWVYAQPFRRLEEWQPTDTVHTVPVAQVLRWKLPVIGPIGLSLPAETPQALARSTPAEALLILASRLSQPDPSSLTPMYLEPFPVARDQ
ncbi:MAG: tRNA (adenosine(37)-N6)-threonylcarbamoyltransferase complex dimerization subunit type 1 TsaB [Thermoanaerobaculum sp.]|nr:tRNA (adenosine(37)-N6)-threonylcarbamoyltransferase complex dimerization subunit type 1 TsaB [Thermoanaerobaculum sp.]MDW7968461.1 tRNA (adenosine(37)-N6)-threonylcarbamoyltransferase complex dimerization subunit type 1 TsaB [Thermoanaerobaculum sp.]